MIIDMPNSIMLLKSLGKEIPFTYLMFFNHSISSDFHLTNTVSETI